MRKLASIQKVLNVRPIPGADIIEVVSVLGWDVVVKKEDNIQIGDLVVYYEVDSFLSEQDPRYNVPAFQERFINWNGKRGMRLKTVKLRKQISQGLVLPLSSFPEIKNPQEGDDVTELLKIDKWESLHEERGNGGGMGNKVAGLYQFPSFIKKTDQERVQNYLYELPKHSEETFEVTVKLDGSSMTVFRIDNTSPNFQYAWEDVRTRNRRQMNPLTRAWDSLLTLLKIRKPLRFIDGLCSRNIQLDPEGDNHFSKYVDDHQIRTQLHYLNRNIAVQGELIAPSIQENYEQVKDFEFYVYDIFDIDKQEYVLPAERRAMVEYMGLKNVPILDEAMPLLNFLKEDVEPREAVDAILAFAEGPGMNPGIKREGVVFKSNKQDFSFKAISNSYLLKKEKQMEAAEKLAKIAEAADTVLSISKVIE